MADVAGDIIIIKGHIDDQIAVQNTRATTAISDARSYLEALTNASLFEIDTIPPVIGGNILITSPLLTALPPDRPTTAIAAIKAGIPTEPGDFEATVTDRSIQDAPQETFSTPVINFPTAPTFTSETKPDPQVIALPGKVPDTPDLTVPTDLTVSAQNVPNTPSISLPSWGETIPALAIDLPTATLAYVEPVYTSALKTALAADLLSKVQNGGTGLNATIEGNIYNRDVERLAQNLADNIDDTINRFSGRGFPLPPGVVAAEVQELQINHTNDRSQQSRDVAIEQAKIADANTKEFLRLGLTLEELEINHANNIANRALEAEKSVVEFSIALFNSKVAKFNAELSRYQAKAIEVENLIRIENLKLEQYKSELSGVETEATKDRVSIENYRAKLASHDAVVRLYEAETNAVVTALNIERAKVEIYKADIDAYIANINAQRNEYDLFLAQIQGEKAKIDLHQSEVSAYIARVTAVKISNDVVIEKIRSDISLEELNLKAYLANVEIWKEKSQLAIQELGLEQSFYSADINKFSEEVRKETAQANLNIESLVRGIALEQSNADLRLQTGIANVNSLIEQSKARITAAKGTSDGYVALASVAAGVIQTMLQLGGQGTSEETTSS